MKTSILTQQIGKVGMALLFFIFLGVNAAQAQEEVQKASKSKTIMLITGAFVSNSGWDEWKSYYEGKGYKVIAPAWPHKKGNPADLRLKQPDSLIAGLSLPEVVDYHARIIDSLGEKPIIIGHSFGGLITQLLVQRGKAAAGIAYHSVPPKGVLVLKYSFLKSLWPPLGLFRSNKKTYLMSFSHWQYTFVNGMDEATQRAYYDKLVIPESRNVLWGALKKPGKIDFKKAHAPLLFVSGSTDNIIPASLNKKTYRKYKKHQPEGSVTDYKEFPGRNHLSMAQDTWKEDADYILDWVSRN